MCFLAISFFLKFYITLTISFRRKKNHSNVMTNFIFCLSTSRHRLNQVDLQELRHCDCTRPLKNSPHCHSRRFSLSTEFIHISMIVRHYFVAVSQCMLRDYLGLNYRKAMNRNWINQKPNHAFKIKMEISKMQIDKIQLVQMANRVGSYFPKGATQQPNPN